MRKPRRDTLASTGLFHKMWRGHNREPVFEDDEDKVRYLRDLARTYSKETASAIAFYSFVLMTNHTHECCGLADPTLLGTLAKLVELLGNWMRNAHSCFGAAFNRRHDRQGKVAYDRPKTKEIDSERGVLDVMMYGDANPVRAGMVSHPSRYPWSSHRYYAYGERSEHTEMLTPPPAYLALGDTPEERQRKYRSLTDLYLRKAGIIEDRPSEDVEEPSVAGDEPAGSGRAPSLAEGSPTQGPPSGVPPS